MRNSNILDDIKELEKNVFEIKSTQPMQGDNFKFFQSDSGLPYDWSGTLDRTGQSPGQKYAVFLVTFTAIKVPFLFADIIFEATGTDIDASSVYFISALSDGTNNQSFYYIVAGTTSSGTVTIKTYAIANDNVTIEVQRI